MRCLTCLFAALPFIALLGSIFMKHFHAYQNHEAFSCMSVAFSWSIFMHIRISMKLHAQVNKEWANQQKTLSWNKREQKHTATMECKTQNDWINSHRSERKCTGTMECRTGMFDQYKQKRNRDMAQPRDPLDREEKETDVWRTKNSTSTKRNSKKHLANILLKRVLRPSNVFSRSAPSLSILLTKARRGTE